MFKPSKLYEEENNKNNSGMLNFIHMTLKFFFVNKYLSIVSHITHMSLITWTISELIYFFLFPSLQFIMDYGFSFFSLFHVYIFTIINYIHEKRISEMDSFMTNHFWNLNCCGPEMTEILSKRARLCKRLGLLQFVVAIINGLLFWPHESDRLDLFFILMILEKKLNTFYQYYRFLFFTCVSWGATIVLTWPNMLTFYVSHLDFQYALLTRHMENIEMGFDKHSSRQSYDAEIGRRLQFCISHFEKLMGFRELFSELLYIPIFLLLWIGLGVSMFLAYHLIVMGQHTNIIALGFLWLTVAGCTIQVAIVGQHYVDMAEDFINCLNKCNWYRWSNSNMKTFLLFVMYTQKYKIITGAGLIPLNFSVTVWMSQKTVSALTFFRAIRRKNH